MQFFYVLFLGLLCIAFGMEFNECSTEEDAMAWLRMKVEKEEKVDKNIISTAVQRSWWTVAEQIVTVAQDQGVDVSSPFARSSAIIKSNLQKIQNLINSKKSDWSIISPTFQWAQGADSININMKYAHKWDTPATLGCSVNNITFFERSVYVESKCPSTKKKFVLDLKMLKDLNPEDCHWSDASVGRVVLMMKKKERGHWENILDAKRMNSPRNMHTWWSMKEQLEKEDESTRKAEEQKRQEEDKKRKEEEDKKEASKKAIEDEKKAEEAEKNAKKAVREASEAAEAEMRKDETGSAEVKTDATIH